MSFYVGNHQGRLVISESDKELLPDVADISAKISPRTRVLLINSPTIQPGGFIMTNFAPNRSVAD
jgi:aspartate/methionine/tyrosine aminotransferase